jgi:hypothetical protein
MPNRRRWFNSWRYYLKQSIPAELKEKVISSPDEEKGEAPSFSAKERGKDYIIVDEEPIRVGAGLGDYSLQDAKDILGIRALRNRFTGAGQPGAPPAATEKVSEILTALEPYINKGSDTNTLKEILADKLALQRQEILSHMSQPGSTAQPKSFIEQITGFVTALSSLKEAGPILRSILGVPETTANPFTPAQVIGLDGQPSVMDLTKVLDLRKFLAEEKRADEKHQALIKFAETARENIPDGIQAILKTVSEVKAGTEAKITAASQPQSFICGNCQTPFSAPAGWAGQALKCPNPQCGREYSKEELLG